MAKVKGGERKRKKINQVRKNNLKEEKE